MTIYHEPSKFILEKEWQKKMVEYLQKNQRITIKDASKLWKVTNRTAASRLNHLRDLGLLVEISKNLNRSKKAFRINTLIIYHKFNLVRRLIKLAKSVKEKLNSD